MQWKKINIKAEFTSKSLLREHKTIQAMVAIYCSRKQHNKGKELCDDCAQLFDYATKRLQKCPFGHEKPACSNCTIHCYNPEMRRKIKKIMRFSGPRMIWKHPIMALVHLLHKHKSRHGSTNQNTGRVPEDTKT